MMTIVNFVCLWGFCWYGTMTAGFLLTAWTRTLCHEPIPMDQKGWWH